MITCSNITTSGVWPGGQTRKQSHKGQKLNTWMNVNMQGAVEEWRMQEDKADGEKCSLRMIARAWNVPYTTLCRRVYGKVQGYSSASVRPTVLKESDEAELVRMIKGLAEVGFPLTRREVQKMAYDFAEAHGCQGFSSKKQAAGYYWFQGFLNRHTDISIKKAENLSVARSMSVDKPQVSKWFESYEDLLKRSGICDFRRQI